MTREELASQSSSRVRKDNALFSLFKKYITEDAALIFSGGKLPNGCFGCQFNQHFRVWSSFILKDKVQVSTKVNTTIMDYSKKTYELENPTYRVFFDGNVLSSSSSDGQWMEWINYAEGDLKKERKEKFKTLPEALVSKQTKSKGKGKGKQESALAPEEVVQEEVNPEPEDNIDE